LTGVVAWSVRAVLENWAWKHKSRGFERAEKSLVSRCRGLLNFISLEPPDIEAP
jgi:hypothetical protein